MKIFLVLKRIQWCVAMVVFFMVVSCSSKKDIVYFQNADQFDQVDFTTLTAAIQPNDILSITVDALVPESVVPYNKRQNNNAMVANNLEVLKLQGYLVDAKGHIDFHVLGAVQVAGKTPGEIEKILERQLSEGGHLMGPEVTVRILNAKFTVLGEVNRPGTYGFTEQFISVPQALGFAGDLTINGKREDILLLRQVDGTQRVYHLDLTRADWLNDPVYSIRQNDVIVVTPNEARVKSAGLVGNSGTVLTIVSLILSSLVLLTR